MRGPARCHANVSPNWQRIRALVGGRRVASAECRALDAIRALSDERLRRTKQIFRLSACNELQLTKLSSTPCAMPKGEVVLRCRGGNVRAAFTLDYFPSGRQLCHFFLLHGDGIA
ncbi:unnamed protein product [Leptosia nina]|uniref:Uncharacterized protein n=1 Tax=Leptosia nina TaxID=320188 RepID=A0AAV1JU03_9NEOP